MLIGEWMFSQSLPSWKLTTAAVGDQVHRRVLMVGSRQVIADLFDAAGVAVQQNDL